MQIHPEVAAKQRNGRKVPTDGLLFRLCDDFITLYSCIIIQMCSGSPLGRVLNGELCAQRFQKLIYLHLFTDWFMKISPELLSLLQHCGSIVALPVDFS